MEEIKEKLNITVEEEAEEQELFFTLNTLQNNSAMEITDIITGKLDAFIISANQQVDIKVSMVEYPVIVIFEARSFVGTEYLSLRISPRDAQNELFNFAPQKWNLNDQLRFEIEGGMNTEVSFIVRVT